MPSFVITGIEVPEHLTQYSELAEYASREEAQVRALGVTSGEIIELEDVDGAGGAVEQPPEQPSKM
jgi:hypothetical protein